MSLFDPKRFVNFVGFELSAAKNELLLPLGLPSALLGLWVLGRVSSGQAIDSWPTVSFLLGLFFALTTTANSFRREIDPTTAPLYLLIPASHLERFACKWVITFALPFFVQALWLTILVNGAALLAPFGANGLILPDSADISSFFGLFLVHHAVFLAGGIFFRSSPVVRTLFAATAYGVAFGALFISIAMARGGSNLGLDINLFVTLTNLSMAVSQSMIVARIAFVVLLPLLLYIAAFYRAVENEMID